MQRELTITVFGGKTLSQLDFVLCRSNFSSVAEVLSLSMILKYWLYIPVLMNRMW